MNFLIDFLTYLLAFGAGAGLTWGVVRVRIRAASAAQALAEIEPATTKVSE